MIRVWLAGGPGRPELPAVCLGFCVGSADYTDLYKMNTCLQKFCLVGLGLLLLGAGCRTAVPVPAVQPPVQVVSPAVTQDVAVVKIRPGLVISFSLLLAGKEEFATTAKRVSDAGTVDLPLLGTVSAQDLTLDQFSAQLAGRYRTYFVNPQVMVDFVRDTGTEGISPWGYVTVLGRVKNPGRISLPATRDLTVSGAIQKAGGLNTSARSEAILITRRKPGGDPETREVNLQAVGSGLRVGDDLVLQAEDVVFVPEARF